MQARTIDVPSEGEHLKKRSHTGTDKVKITDPTETGKFSGARESQFALYVYAHAFDKTKREAQEKLEKVMGL